jgi:hypothetical protein
VNQPSKELLVKLLGFWQENPHRERRITLPVTKKRAPEYYRVISPSERESLHAGLEEAVAAGAVSIEWGRGYDSAILKRIVLIDGEKLSAYLGVPIGADLAQSGSSILENAITGEFFWVREWTQELLSHWEKNKPFNGIAPGDTKTAVQLVKAFEAVAAGRQENLDLRTFSARELGHSKAMEALLTKFTSAWKKYHPTILTSSELLETLGLVKFPHPLLLSGPISLSLNCCVVDCRNVRPYIGLPPQTITSIEDAVDVDYVLTIENLASFNRHVAEIEDQGLIVYTAGFPAPGVADFLRLLDNSLSRKVSFFHWGDIDEGGIKIISFIQGLLARPVIPHLMTSELLRQVGVPSLEVRLDKIQGLVKGDDAISSLVKIIQEETPVKTLEQENVNPMAPKLNSGL